MNLLWNEYVGREIGFYRINRKADGGEWETAGTVLGNVQIFSDEDPGELPKTYVVEAIPRDTELTLGKNALSNEIRVVSTGIGNIPGDKNIRIYPNPFKDHLNVHFEWEEGKKGIIELHNVLGEICRQWEFSSSSVILDTGDVTEGTYLLTVRGKNAIRRIVIR